MDSEEYSESDSSYEDISDESDSDEDTLDAARNWCRIDQENLAPPPQRFPFSGNPGLNTRMDGSSPIEFFCIFFDDDIVYTYKRQCLCACVCVCLSAMSRRIYSTYSHEIWHTGSRNGD
ncbi:hypothetical protein AVEN_140229-1 [Araneus ventricosus]|uniref:PiggyBac transposable element-derived protein domain-containing protein n=1 Tax=Araneus ventricosus TaxID=182803 RepID=A0A4Y2I796_ARAVE|nr:hypothetical protein AVEN_140229-1 [Araneus ventricosus]